MLIDAIIDADAIIAMPLLSMADAIISIDIISLFIPALSPSLTPCRCPLFR
jgi:hypothetical protein